jgi:hypothetical protein
VNVSHIGMGLARDVWLALAGELAPV